MTDDQSPQLAGDTPPKDSPTLGGARGTAHLLELLQHEDEDVRQRALFELGERGEESAFEHLAELAESPDATSRQRAAWLLGYFRSDAALERLMQMAIDDDEWHVRQTAGRQVARYPLDEVSKRLESAFAVPELAKNAIEVLSHRRDERTAEALIRAAWRIDLPNGGLMAAMRALGAFRTEAAFEALRDSLGKRYIIDATIIQSMWRQNWPAAVPLLIERLKQEQHKDPYKQALYALGHMTDRATAEELVPRFIEALAHSDKYVRGAAIDALGRIATPEALEALAQHAADENSWFEQLTTARALKPWMADDLRDILRGHLQGEGVANTVAVLAELQDEALTPDLIPLFATLDATDEDDATIMDDIVKTVRDLDFLRPLLAHENDRIAGYALIRLAERGEDAGVAAALDLESRYEMWQALVAARALGDEALVPALLTAEASGLSDHDTGLWMRAMATCATREHAEHLAPYLEMGSTDAAQVLGELGALGYVPALMHMARSHPHPWGARYGAEALGKLGDPRALPLLRHMAGNHHGYDGRKNAIIALGEMRDAEAVDILIEALRWDNQAANRAEAATALGKIGDAAALPHLTAMLERSGHGDVRLAVVRAITAIGPDETAREVLAAHHEREPHRAIREEISHVNH